jgi:hypothetical protein
MPNIELTPHELELLKIAIPFAQELGEVPTQSVLLDKLRCRDKSARKIQHYLINTNAVKTADRIEAIPIRAENKANIQHALGDEQFGTSYSHVVRENARLRKQIAKQKFEQEASSEVRQQQVKEELEALKEQGQANAAKPPQFIRTKELKLESGNLLEVNIPDAHFGKLAWGVETGGRPYDVQIAVEMYKRAARTVVSRAITSGIKFDRILYVVGNDILNANDSENKTAHGTVVTTDGRYHKTFRKLRETVVELIEEFRQIAPVDVYVVYGNHDTLSAWHLGDSLDCYFHAYGDVKVQNQPTYRKYFEFGKVMLMLTHGDKAQRDDYPLLMAHEQPQMWARTMHREAQTGHNHKTKLDEFHGIRVRILPALCPADDWHAENGYVGNLRNAEAYLWNQNEGMIAMFTYNDDSQAAIKTKREIV